MTSPAVQHYLDSFARAACLSEGAPWLHETRQQALAQFAAAGFPTTKTEAWKYTRLYALEQQPFQLAEAAPSASAPNIEGLDAYTVIFSNGRLASPLPKLDKGIRLAALADLFATEAETLTPYLTSTETETFANLNTAFLRDGVFLELADNVVLDKPLRLVFLAQSGAEPGMTHPRVIVRLGRGAQATLIEHYAGTTDQTGFTNAITQIELASNAELHHYRLQEEATTQFHIASLTVRQARDSRLQAHNFMLGGKLARLQTHIHLQEPGAESRLSGLTLAGEQQHHDNHLLVEHATGPSRSEQDYRAVIADRARGVWNGKVVVQPGADGADARQSSKNLLLGKLAEVDTKPELEIYADEVKCSHGATVGQLDMDALFYLRSRGVDEAVARSLLVFAFADSVLAGIGIPALRKYLEQQLIMRLPDSDRIREFA